MNVTQSADDRWSASNTEGCLPPPAPRTGQHGFDVTRHAYRRIGVVALVGVMMSILFVGATAPAAHGATPARASASTGIKSPSLHAHAAAPTCFTDTHGNSMCVQGTEVGTIEVSYKFSTYVDNFFYLYIHGVHTGISTYPLIPDYSGRGSFSYAVTVPSDQYQGSICASSGGISDGICPGNCVSKQGDWCPDFNVTVSRPGPQPTGSKCIESTNGLEEGIVWTGDVVCIYAYVDTLQLGFYNFFPEGPIYGGIDAEGIAGHETIDTVFPFNGFSYTHTFTVPGDTYQGDFCAKTMYPQSPNGYDLCGTFDLVTSFGGYRLAAADGWVYGAGNAAVYGYLSVSPSNNPVVGIASTPDGKGYWEVTRNGSVAAYGDAKNFNDLPGLHVDVNNIVAIAPTSDGKGYWLVGGDGGEFAFGDAGYHGSLPGLHIHVDNIVGMVATPNGKGYVLVGSDGGVFVFGGVYHGSLPGLHIHVDNIVGILPTGAETGYVLVGSDGGAFVFGTGSGFYGSLPGEGIHVSDVVGIALTSDQHGYWIALATGGVAIFGDASEFVTPLGKTSHLPITAIAGT